MTRPAGRCGARRAAGTLALALAMAPAPLLASAGPASAADDMPCDETAVPGSDRLADATTGIDEVKVRLHIEEAHEISRGRGVRVAVLDGGIDGSGLPVVGRLGVGGLVPERLTGHGTIVAGIIAGRDGVAPDAQLIDVRVMDTVTPDYSQGQKGLTSGGIAEGIERLLAATRADPPEVVNISLAVRDNDDPRLKAAIAALVRRDVVVVASAGNAVQSDDEGGAPFEGTPESDAPIYPADYPGVVAVSAVPPDNDDPRPYVVPNRDTDVAAPTLGAISQNATGQRCVVGQVATSWATAEVSGVVALLRSRYPKDTAAQIVARLLHTTEGGVSDPGARNPWTGYGVVQAHDALVRQLSPKKSGTLKVSETRIRSDAQAPPAPEKLDLFGSSRALLLWFGLLAGTLLALAFMLRPLFRRS
ncbi:hypothetical protein DDE18_12900 [Nocardioides gansuensis]|uniref:Peptidase S8/S53 domain-containing protein n=1 Tax=Nocardioides gansuensis TaxID=2138300 RepID=A0A2T8F9L4_9ACTN|nr:S8 family serine peptidase [Nocardioides gansuensis]PVG82373.1 hypothetical protein DDE18_12900 [Nocardioides gansuensis]